MIIHMNCICKKFESKIILNNISYNFESGQAYIINGRSGSGKTTLLNIIAGYLSQDSGDIQIEDNSKIEYLFQDEILFSNLTVRENMMIKFLSINDQIDDADISFFQKILSKLNIERLFGSKISLLSGGERQRVQIANIMLMNPDIVLMDEPTAKLDFENMNDLMQVVAQIFNDKILIIVSHDKLDSYFESVNLLNLENGNLITTNGEKL